MGTGDKEGAAEIRWETQAPENQSSQEWEFSAREDGGNARDSLRLSQQIAPAVPVTVQHASFGRLDGKQELPITLPTGALPGKGGLEISLSPRLASPPAGLTRFFEQYPYSCLEQRTSIAIGLRDEKRWQQVIEALPGLLDNDGLARYFPGSQPGSPTLTAYLLDISRAAGFSLPEDSRQRLLRGLTAYVEGRIGSTEWAPGGDASLARRLHALAALGRHGEKPQRQAAASKP